MQTFTDTGGNKGLAPGTYYYRVKAFAAGLPDSAYSNVDGVRFALPGQPLTVSHGFESSGDLTANGSAEIFPVPAPVGTFAGQVFIACVVEGGVVLTDFFQQCLQISTTNRTAASMRRW